MRDRLGWGVSRRTAFLSPKGLLCHQTSDQTTKNGFAGVRVDLARRSRFQETRQNG